uniref:Very-long-chain 3-oxoacyl-CoA synthase n=1 Tax=Timema monikensis TaxID=170555 RepID=A0A7R9EJJ0_9NEOP|nr:unnamed protein product [Timema monikensis]
MCFPEQCLTILSLSDRECDVTESLQFGLVFIHSAQVLIFDCGYPKLVAALLLLHSVIFFALFFDFYRQAYKKSQKLRKLE